MRRPTPARHGRPAHLKHPLTLALQGVASGAQRLQVPRVVRINVYVSPQPTAQRSRMINLDSRRQKLVTAGTPVRIRVQQSQSRISPKSSSLRHPHRATHHPHSLIHPCTQAASSASRRSTEPPRTPRPRNKQHDCHTIIIVAVAVGKTLSTAAALTDARGGPRRSVRSLSQRRRSSIVRALRRGG